MKNGNVRMALTSLRTARGRSLLTMFGIIVGVVAVVVTISLGEGVKRQLSDQINHLGSNVIAVRPGDSSQSASYLSGAGIFSGLSTSPLTAADINVVQQSSGVSAAVPLAVASGLATVGQNHLVGGSIIATTSDLPQVLRQPIRFGIFFSDEQSTGNVAVIGQSVAEELFGESAPIGRSLTIRGQDYLVTGVFDNFAGSSLSLGTDLNKAVFIPYQAVSGNQGATLPIAEIFALARPEAGLAATAQTIRRNLASSHSGQQDFTVLQRQDALAASSSYVTLITQVFTAVAGLSLLVGGIGIANIMLVSVTERTREIGVRKAIGATNRQILDQFLIEAAILSLVGGLIGVVLSLSTIFIIRISTSLHPIMTWPVLVAAPLIAWLVGVVFGVAPAVKAARKDPIDALRYE
jgi:ABC-type antimicrobial peptide transport system permease subunit